MKKIIEGATAKNQVSQVSENLNPAETTKSNVDFTNFQKQEPPDELLQNLLDGLLRGSSNEEEDYLDARFDFRYNKVTNKIEFKTKEESNYGELTDYAFYSMLRDMKKNGLKCNSNELKKILKSDFVPTYDPFLDYFNNLPEWDGQTDYIEQLANTVATTNQAMFKKYLKKFIVGLVAGATLPDKINHTVLVFSGAQGIGKTAWLKKLVPAPLFKYYYEGTLSIKDKDTLVNLSECLIINMDELENLNRGEVHGLKQLITKTQIRVRRPYGHLIETMPRRASFVGSINQKEFLTDDTGNRRYLCFDAQSINYMHSVPIDNVYAQAMALIRAGFQYWLDEADIAELKAYSEEFQSFSLEEEMLMKFYRKPESNEDTIEVLTTSEIVQKISTLCKMPVSNSVMQRMGKALRKYGFKRIKHSNKYAYVVVRK